jgi:hypothetical protein
MTRRRRPASIGPAATATNAYRKQNNQLEKVSNATFQPPLSLFLCLFSEFLQVFLCLLQELFCVEEQLNGFFKPLFDGIFH